MNNDNATARHITRRSPLTGCLTALGMAFAIALPQAAQAQTVTPPPVPDNIRVPAGNEAFLLGRGVGTQNYVCQPAGSLGRVAWTLFTPQATLLSDQAQQLTTHFFSPNPLPLLLKMFHQGTMTATTIARTMRSSGSPI